MFVHSIFVQTAFFCFEISMFVHSNIRFFFKLHLLFFEKFVHSFFEARFLKTTFCFFSKCLSVFFFLKLHLSVFRFFVRSLLKINIKCTQKNTQSQNIFAYYMFIKRHCTYHFCTKFYFPAMTKFNKESYTFGLDESSQYIHIHIYHFMNNICLCFLFRILSRMVATFEPKLTHLSQTLQPIHNYSQRHSLRHPLRCAYTIVLSMSCCMQYC